GQQFKAELDTEKGDGSGPLIDGLKGRTGILSEIELVSLRESSAHAYPMANLAGHQGATVQWTDVIRSAVEQSRQVGHEADRHESDGSIVLRREHTARDANGVFCVVLRLQGAGEFRGDLLGIL